jgi:predicted permease
MRDWLQDLRYGIRMIAKRPGTSAIAIVALALGIGLTTTMFSIVQGVILRGLPFPESERLAFIVRSSVQQPQNRSQIPAHDFVDFRDRQTTLESLAGYYTTSVTIAGDTELPERLRTARLTPNTFAVLRVAPILGRDLNDADAAPGAPAVALISYRQWESRFKGSRDAIGATIRLDGTPTTIIGVMPEKFGFPEAEHIWLPHVVTLPQKRGDQSARTLNVIGRLRDGVTMEQASAEFAGIARQLAETYPENKDIIARAAPMIEQSIPQRIRTTFFAMLTAVFGVMLIACVNVTNLQLARAAERAREFAIRSALGSGRWRVVRQSLAEGLVLSVIGASIGLGLAQFGVTYFMSAIADTQPPFWIDVRLDTTVLAFVTAITVAATLVSSVAPGLRVARVDANAVLKDDTRGATGVRMGRFGRWLVVVEVTVSCVLLVVSGLMIRGILNNSRLDYPFATRDVFFAGMSLDSRTHADTDAVTRGVDDLLQRLRAVPGVRQMAVTTGVPGTGFAPRLVVEGATYATEEEQPRAAQINATPGYFDVLDIRVREGRLFNDSDTRSTERVALVDEAFVARHLSGGPAIGRRLRIGDGKQPWLTIVGVVPSLVRQTQPGQIVESIYVPFAQSASRGFTILARTAGDPLALAPAIRSTVAEHFQDAPLSNVNSLAGEYWRRGWAFRLFGGLFLLFGAAALLMAAAGLYGVMSFMVRRRTQEIGVRMALGASRRGVLTLVMWQGLWRVALGIALGLYPGYFLAGQMQALTPGMSAADPVVHITTAITLLLSGTLATLVPAHRASSVDPLTALRRD